MSKETRNNFEMIFLRIHRIQKVLTRLKPFSCVALSSVDDCVHALMTSASLYSFQTLFNLVVTVSIYAKKINKYILVCVLAASEGLLHAAARHVIRSSIHFQ